VLEVRYDCAGCGEAMRVIAADEPLPAGFERLRGAYCRDAEPHPHLRCDRCSPASWCACLLSRRAARP
jgi:hypothetical protein